MAFALPPTKLGRMANAARSSDRAPRTSTASPPLTALLLDRAADVPIGVQLTWAIKAKIADGSMVAGERLPGLRDLADALHVNVNTVRAVYARLEGEGLLDSHQGSGTFVTEAERPGPQAGVIAARAAREARAAGVDPRDVASALYVQGGHLQITQAEAARRSALRGQIAALDQALGELEAEHPSLARRLSVPRPQTRGAGKRARLPSAAELDQAKGLLLRQISAMQAAIDALESGEAPAGAASEPDRGAAKSELESQAKPKSAGSRSRRGSSRPAIAGA